MILLLLRSPAICQEFTILSEIFLRIVTVFESNHEVVPFRLRGWYMLGVFLLPAFTRLGHGGQDLLSSCDGLHVCTDQTSVYTLIQRHFGGMESKPVLTPEKKCPLPEFVFLRGGSNPGRCITQDSEPNTLPTELFRPLARDEPRLTLSGLTCLGSLCFVICTVMKKPQLVYFTVIVSFQS